eukprot:2517269-Pyramimonas_sp.AAC.1
MSSVFAGRARLEIRGAGCVLGRFIGSVSEQQARGAPANWRSKNGIQCIRTALEPHQYHKTEQV